jgi:hypothetical protein
MQDIRVCMYVCMYVGMHVLLLPPHLLSSSTKLPQFMNIANFHGQSWMLIYSCFVYYIDYIR